MTKIQKLAVYLFIGVMVFSGNNKSAFAVQDTAAETETNTKEVSSQDDSQDTVAEESIAGIALTLDECYQGEDNADKQITSYLTADTEEDIKQLGFAKAANYVNIRNKPEEGSEIVGKLYKNSAATILSKQDGWYQIESGSVKGYIKADFLVVGDKAAALAKSVGKKLATVNTTTLKVRKKASGNAQVLDLVAQGDKFKVVKVQKGWIKISLGNKQYGYLSSDFVKIHTEYEEAVSIEEEQKQLEQEVKAEAQRASRASVSRSKTSIASTRNSSVRETTSQSSTSSSLGSRLAAYALQFQGNPYVWGGTSLTNGTDCSGFTQSVYAHFGISIPRSSRTQAASGSSVSISNLAVGDLVFYAKGGTINHVALYIGNGKVISASSPSTGIRITSYNYRQPVKAVRYIG